jgi:hypothetical protein
VRFGNENSSRPVCGHNQNSKCNRGLKKGQGSIAQWNSQELREQRFVDLHGYETGLRLTPSSFFTPSRTFSSFCSMAWGEKIEVMPLTNSICTNVGPAGISLIELWE